MWPDEAESLEDAAAGDPSSAGGGGGSSSSYYLDEGRPGGSGGNDRSSYPASTAAPADEEARPSPASKSKQPDREAGSSEDRTMGADGGLREEWELMTTDEKVNKMYLLQGG